MPTKTLDRAGDIRNWPADFEEEIENTIIGDGNKFSLEGTTSTIKELAQRSDRDNTIQFDEDAFVSEGLLSMERIGNMKILDLAKRKDSTGAIYKRLERSRIFNEVKDHTLLDVMGDDTKRQKIIGYSLYGKRRPNDESDLDRDLDLDEYVSGFENVPQTADIGKDVPHMPISAWPEPDTMLLNHMDFLPFKLIYNSDTGVIFKSKEDRTLSFEYHTTKQQRKFLSSLYPNVQHDVSKQRIFVKDPKEGEIMASGSIELGNGKDPILSSVMRLDKEGRRPQVVAKKWINDTVVPMLLKKFEKEAIPKLVEANRGHGLRDEKYRVSIVTEWSTQKQIAATTKKTGEEVEAREVKTDTQRITWKDTLKTIRYTIRVQSKMNGEFKISPFSYEYRGKAFFRKKTIKEILRAQYPEKEEFDNAYGAFKEYRDLPQDISKEERKKALVEMEQKFNLSENEVIAITQTVESGQEKENETSQGSEYGYNEDLADIIETIIHNYSEVKEQIEEGV
mgnify:CR=1 FL=1|tara:strand:- start:1568 stop:3088 length:1521 start_codon:yes stop_codon:yes gene_type:complete